MLGQSQIALPQQLRPIDHGMHENILAGSKEAAVLPGEHLILGEYVVIVDGVGGIVRHVLIDIVAQHHIERRFHGLNPQLTQYLF